MSSKLLFEPIDWTESTKEYHNGQKNRFCYILRKILVYLPMLLNIPTIVF